MSAHPVAERPECCGMLKRPDTAERLTVLPFVSPGFAMDPRYPLRDWGQGWIRPRE